MPEVLEIVQRGHLILTKRAHDVEDVNDPVVQSLIENMTLTYQKNNGLGIAAPQVNEGRRMFVMSSKKSRLYRDAKRMNATAVFNPVILETSTEMKTDWESCLSIPGMYGLVPRHVWIRVEFTNRKGVRVRKTFKDFHARIFQHELDHLDGILFTRYMDSKDLLTKEEFEIRTAGE